MYKLKIAVGISGRIIVLEKFPNDEKHQGLDEMLEGLENDYMEFTEPGVYEANIIVETLAPRDPQDDNCFLLIKSLNLIYSLK